jgi:heme A synthase
VDRRLQRLALAVLVWNLLVILWGAYVRASGSGAGCGAHWPLCDGEVVPRAPSAERLIEWTHRATSGLALLAGLALAVAAFRWRPAGHPARRWAAISLALLLVEAGLGAGLVLFELVADDASPARAVAMMLHLVNTFLLLAALVLTLHHADAEAAAAGELDPAIRRLWIPSLVLLVFAGASGAVAALGDTLFPARSITEALAQDLSPASSLLLRLRTLHPAIAVAAAVAVLVFALRLLQRSEAPAAQRRARIAGLLALVQLAVGTINLGLLAPIPLQLLHLLLADLLWIATVLAGVASPPGGLTATRTS